MDYLVLKAKLESQGTLSNFRNAMKLELIRSIRDGNSPAFALPLLPESNYVSLMNQLIFEYLEYFQYKNAAKTFAFESDIREEGRLSREVMQRQLHLAIEGGGGDSIWTKENKDGMSTYFSAFFTSHPAGRCSSLHSLLAKALLNK